MSTSILATKLYIPSLRPNMVLRPRLIERLNEGLHRKLTLVSAPAGFGKTTLICEWLAGCERPTAWLSLDAADNEPMRFLTYLVAALQTIAPNIGAGVLVVLQSPQPPPTESMLIALLNELSALPDSFVLVLDDYHAIDTKLVDDALTFLLDHLSPQLHLVITTREDPQLPLARLRARGQMTELRAVDLRFTAVEAAGFLNQSMGLNLAPEHIDALEARTEGWIAGLQLAAISMRGHHDASSFITSFTGSHHFVLDYLVEEVLQQQPERVQTFLLRTSILDRLCGSLCDAVLADRDATGQETLEYIERANLFLVPLDNERHWYRYHHLFADVLSKHLLAEQSDQVATLHRRASMWFEQNGLVTDAIRHALVAKDFMRAADLVELSVPFMRRSRQESAVLGWLKMLPDEVVRCRPVLSATYAWAILMNGELEGVEARLRDVERWLNATADGRERSRAPSAEMIVKNDSEFHRLPGAIAVWRAAHALALGNVSGTMNYARRALDLIPQGDHLLRGSAAGLLALAYWTHGNLEAAHRSYAECMVGVQRAGHISDAIGCSIALADIRVAQGRLGEAMRTYEYALELALEHGAPVLRGTADVYVGMSELCRERGDLQLAEQHLQSSQQLGEHMGLPRHQFRWRVAMARIRQTQGDLDGALDLLQQAERLYVADFHPNVRPIAALKARVWVAQGRIGDVLGWAREQGLSVDDDLSYLREFEHITLARALLAQYRNHREARALREAVGLLERLLSAAEDGDRTGSEIEILVLQALAHQMVDDIPVALAPLERAITLAEPEGYVRLFVDEGLPMAQLMSLASAHGIMPDYTESLLAAFEAEGLTTKPKPSLIQTSLASSLIEPLSQRELEVLQLIAQGLSNREISERLFLALDTVKGHNRKIFGKLDVQRRTEAIARARELGLL